MNKIIDLHTHLDTLDPIIKLRSILQGHLISIDNHNKESKVILNVAIYSLRIKGFSHIVEMIKKIKDEITSKDQVILIESQRELNSNFKIGIILHLESARCLKDYPTQLPILFKLGVRGIIPLHFVDNLFGNSCDDPLRRLYTNKKDNGLSEDGIKLVKLANTLGMWIDLSHCTDKTAIDICKVADNVMVSHVGFREIVGFKRNFSKKVLIEVIKKNGLIGLTPWQHLIGNSYESYKKTIEFGLKNEYGNSLCIGSDFGAPIKTHSSIKSIFDLRKIVNQMNDDSNRILWDNGYNFFNKVLPKD